MHSHFHTSLALAIQSALLQSIPQVRTVNSAGSSAATNVPSAPRWLVGDFSVVAVPRAVIIFFDDLAQHVVGKCWTVVGVWHIHRCHEARCW